MINVEIAKKLHYFDLNIRFSVNKEVYAIQGHSGLERPQLKLNLIYMAVTQFTACT